MAEYKDKSIKLCKHCGWGGGAVSATQWGHKGISGTYCDDCSTADKRRELDKSQKELEASRV